MSAPNEMATPAAQLQQLATELLGFLGQDHSTVEIGVTAKGEPTWLIKARDPDVFEAAKAALGLHQQFAQIFGRGEGNFAAAGEEATAS
ncbi:MAG: hypothetical protein ACYDAD_07950 [Acidimicrobiales bacterium]